MTLDGFFRGIGSFMQWTFNLLQNDFTFFDFSLTFIMNYGLLCVGFIGLFYWLNIQKKLSAKAEAEGTLK
ncbi:MAG: hypothetical protein HRT57_05300 [Crocinitomicaceae bacterium]|nr:hypothetical protein [Crocinitomicaceae bacterium]